MTELKEKHWADSPHKIIWADPNKLIEPKSNPNVMDPADYAMLERAIEKVGFLQPVLVSKDLEIIDGVHRTRAAKSLGINGIPCVVVDANSSTATALQIGMNKLRGELDLTRVTDSLLALTKEGWGLAELTITGFSEDDIEALLHSVASPTETEVMQGSPEPETEPEESSVGTVLEVEFHTKQELLSCKRQLRKLIGKGRPLGDAILLLLGRD
jgi:ParB-like chromosome segregation protein Spo0J